MRSSDQIQRDINTDNLFAAINDKNIDRVNVLVLLDIDWAKTIKRRDKDCTVLNLASRVRFWEAVEVIVKRLHAILPDMTTCDVHYGCAILCAAGAGQIPMLQLLLSYQPKTGEIAVFNQWRYDGSVTFALHETVALKNNSETATHLLLDYGYPLTNRNAKEQLPVDVAMEARAWGCLKLIAKKLKEQNQLLRPERFSGCPSDILLTMMLENIPLTAPGYQHKSLQEERLFVLDTLLKLPADTDIEKNKKIAALRQAKDKTTLIGDYFLDYEVHPVVAFFGLFKDHSAESVAARIDQELAALLPQPKPRASTTDLLDDLGVDDTAADGDELELIFADRNADEDSESTLESVSHEESAESNNKKTEHTLGL